MLQYDYTLLDANSETSVNTDALRRKVSKSVCEDILSGLDPNVRVRFRYAGGDGKSLAAVEISRADCTKKP